MRLTLNITDFGRYIHLYWFWRSVALVWGLISGVWIPPNLLPRINVNFCDEMRLTWTLENSLRKLQKCSIWACHYGVQELASVNSDQWNVFFGTVTAALKGKIEAPWGLCGDFEASNLGIFNHLVVTHKG